MHVLKQKNLTQQCRRGFISTHEIIFLHKNPLGCQNVTQSNGICNDIARGKWNFAALSISLKKNLKRQRRLSRIKDLFLVSLRLAIVEENYFLLSQIPRSLRGLFPFLSG